MLATVRLSERQYASDPCGSASGGTVQHSVRRTLARGACGTAVTLSYARGSARGTAGRISHTRMVCLGNSGITALFPLAGIRVRGPPLRRGGQGGNEVTCIVPRSMSRPPCLKWHTGGGMGHGSWGRAHTRARSGHPLVGLTACVHGLPSRTLPGATQGGATVRVRSVRGDERRSLQAPSISQSAKISQGGPWERRRLAGISPETLFASATRKSPRG